CEVRLLLADAVAADGHALGLKLCLHLVGEAGAVGLLVVDDVDALELERAGDVSGDALALRRVRRDGAEEEAGPRAVERDLRVRRRAGDPAESCSLERPSRRLHLVRAGRADDAENGG